MGWRLDDSRLPTLRVALSLSVRDAAGVDEEAAVRLDRARGRVRDALGGT